MKVKPVKFYKIPQYPTRAQFLESSASLKDSLPAGWKNNKIVTAALAVFLLGTNAGKEKSVPLLKEKVQLNNNNSVREDAKIIEKENVPSVAPVFIHGGGRGAIGCV